MEIIMVLRKRLPLSFPLLQLVLFKQIQALNIYSLSSSDVFVE